LLRRGDGAAHSREKTPDVAIGSTAAVLVQPISKTIMSQNSLFHVFRRSYDIAHNLLKGCTALRAIPATGTL
jgi:hypothetical protein